jgi:hypothetical protein
MRCGRSPGASSVACFLSHAAQCSLRVVRCVLHVACCPLRAAGCIILSRDRRLLVLRSHRVVAVWLPQDRRVEGRGEGRLQAGVERVGGAARVGVLGERGARAAGILLILQHRTTSGATQDNHRCNTGQPPCSEAQQRQPTCNAARPFAPHRGVAASIRLAFRGIARGPS